MTALPAFDDDDLPELPAATQAEITSWRDVFNNADPLQMPTLLQRAAGSLFQHRKVNRTVHPESDAIVGQEIADALADLALLAAIDADQAQQIFAAAQRGEQPAPLNGRVPSEPPPVNGPADYGIEGDDDRQANGPIDPAPIKEAIASLIKTSAQFVANFVPPDYTVDGLLQEGFLYSLTGPTGAGKTAITLRLAASTALGIVFAGRETKKRRVLYFAGENADDVRMRWIALSQQMGFDIDTIEVFFVERVFKISEAKDQLRKEAEEHGGEFGLVIIDTSAVFYEGDDENSRKQQGNHAVLLRELISVIPGKPAVIANCHPVKHADADNLLPAGGGNFLNQVDGNLTAAKNDSTTELHTQGKFRGVEFAPIHFLIKTVTHERVKDSRGRLIPTVICEWISDKEKEGIAAQKVSDDDAILKLIADDPKASQADLAIKMGWKLHNGEPNKMRVSRCIKTLLKHKLIKETRRGNYVLSP